ncbi:MAG: TRAP transporter substrate-binding protein DctP [Myxococcota bacterium]
MIRRSLLVLVSCLASVALAAEPVVLKVGSTAPRESPWGAVLRVWQKAVKEKTKGEVTIEIFWNATQGDEAAQMSKVKTGQLDGAIVTAVGLGVIDPNVNVLQVPGLYPDWATLDRVRDALKPRFEKSFREAGVELIGWGDVGLDRFMSKGYPVKAPADLKGKRAWVWREDPILPPLYQVTGTVIVPTALPEVLPELSTGNVTLLSVSALAAEQLQWASRVDHVTRMVVAPNIGGMVLSKAKLDALPAASRDAVLETGRVAAKALTERIRGEDVKAFERLEKRMTVVDATPEELKAWKAAFLEARARLGKGTFPAELLKEVESLAK